MDDSMDGRHGMGQSLWMWVCDTLTDYTRRRPQSEHGVQLGVYVHEKNAKDVRRILVALSQWQQTQEELFPILTCRKSEILIWDFRRC